jgi:hypothetical protein
MIGFYRFNYNERVLITTPSQKTIKTPYFESGEVCAELLNSVQFVLIEITKDDKFFIACQNIIAKQAKS